MTIWSLHDHSDAQAIAGDDSLIACWLAPDSRLYATDGAWAMLNQERPGYWSIMMEAQPGFDKLDEAIDELGDYARSFGGDLGWASFTASIPAALKGDWSYHDQWVWLGTKALAREPEPRWAIVELDDTDDADEINEFGMRHNPRFEGDPGKGITDIWLGVREPETGRLLGIGGVHRTANGHGNLGGYVVDEACRGTGIGTDLLVALTRHMLAATGLATISAFANNEHAIAIYRSFGYILEHRFQAWGRIPRR